MIGSVAELWRYPVKSMMGERLQEVNVTERGCVGDRAYALVDRETGKVGTAKNPRKWPDLFECHASFVQDPVDGADMPPVEIRLPDGRVTRSDAGDAASIISQALGREVTLEKAAQWSNGRGSAHSEAYWPDEVEGLSKTGVTEFTLPKGTFFDGAFFHLLTTATLDELSAHHPAGRFEAPRFRPNMVVNTPSEMTGFIEDGWIGRSIRLGPEVRLRVIRPCSRCVMTTLPQRALPRDLDILRTIVRANDAHLGVYATVERPGIVRMDDRLSFD